MADTTHPYAERIRALAAVLEAHPLLSMCETRDADGTYVTVRRYGLGLHAHVHPARAVESDLGTYEGDFEQAGGEFKFGVYRAEIDGVTVTTYATRR